MTPEFSRRVTIDTLGDGGRKVGIAADADECAALARRFGWTSITSLEANAQLLSRADGYDALGTLSAIIERPCVASGEPVRERIEDAFAIHFVAAGQATEHAEELELDEDDLDTVEFDGAAIDLGEAVAQSLALSVSPFPRSSSAAAALKSAGVLDEVEVGSSAFAGLKELLKK